MGKEEIRLQTGTTTLAIVCNDGLVFAADRRVTAGPLIVNKKFTKIDQIADNMLMTMAGSVSDVQLLIKLVKAQTKLRKIRTGSISVKEAAHYLSGLVYSNIRKFSAVPGISHFIIGGKDHTGYHLYDIFPDGSITESDAWISSGSGSEMVFGVMESSFKKGLSVDEGVKLALRGINAALQRDSASGEGVDVFTITKDGVKKAVAKDLQVKAD